MLRFVAFILFALMAAPASAHYYAWSDADFRFTLSFPDKWKDQGGLPADGRIKVLAPGNDGATCTVFAKSDKRYTIYPRDYMVEVVAQEIQWDYWEQAIANYDELTFYYDNYGALGAGDARYVLVDYIDRTNDPIRKRALVFATIYADLHMMVHCSAPIENFAARWSDFGQIVESVKFEPRYAETYRGHYRDFLEKKERGFHWHEPIVSFLMPRKAASAIVNCPQSEDFQSCLYKPKPPQIRTR